MTPSTMTRAELVYEAENLLDLSMNADRAQDARTEQLAQAHCLLLLAMARDSFDSQGRLLTVVAL